MKFWSNNHPKATLMARKRAAILDAARDAFFRLGFEGTSMDTIANAAGVSVMTLYRHAEGKEDLFGAVISKACDPSDRVEQADVAALMQKPLEEALFLVGVRFQETLAKSETAALLRTVIAESSRFPHLAETAYHAFIGTQEDAVETLLSQKAEASDFTAAERRKFSATFTNRLVGADMLRMFLGLEAASAEDHQSRSQSATNELLAAMSRGRQWSLDRKMAT